MFVPPRSQYVICVSFGDQTKPNRTMPNQATGVQIQTQKEDRKLLVSIFIPLSTRTQNTGTSTDAKGPFPLLTLMTTMMNTVIVTPDPKFAEDPRSRSKERKGKRREIEKRKKRKKKILTKGYRKRVLRTAVNGRRST